MLPTFLGIGAQRAGTTRLHRLLAAHPEIQMPTTGTDPFGKELHFFDSRIRTHDLAWYGRQFEPPPGAAARPVRGEITPAYSILDERLVAGIHRLLPALRLVFVIRNPVDRIWSALLMALANWQEGAAGVQLPAVERLAGVAESPAVVLRTDYQRTIDTWMRVFGRDALLVVLFEEQFRAPRHTLRRILDHLGADPDWAPSEELASAKTRSAAQVECPPFLRYHLARRWLPRVESLNDKLDGRVTEWVDELREASSAAPGGWRARSRACVLRSTLPNMGESAAHRALSMLLRRRMRRLGTLTPEGLA